jgi:hypothetical protein
MQYDLNSGAGHIKKNKTRKTWHYTKIRYNIFNDW